MGVSISKSFEIVFLTENTIWDLEERTKYTFEELLEKLHYGYKTNCVYAFTVWKKEKLN